MTSIIHEILALPGVLGSCVVDKDKQILLANLPHGFDETMATEVASSVSRIIQMAGMKGMQPQTISIHYNKFILLTLAIDDSAFLVIQCKPGSNTPLITTTASMLAPEISKGIANADIKPEQTSSMASPQEAKGAMTPETVQALESIKQSLFATVGPIADMIFDDCVERWTESNQGNLSRFFELAGYISSELDNPEMFQEFKEKISHYL
jgi:predicted regulator of Ras-like GTPase activity (Roadblock/LC7/MglB family)